jgi:hypothetical protein
MSFLISIIVAEMYSPIDNSIKPKFDNFVIQTWTKLSPPH